MIALYRRMKRGPRAAMLMKIGIGIACFIVLAGSGVLLAYLFRDKSVKQTAEVNTKTVSSSQKDTSNDTLPLSKHADNGEDETEQDAQATQTTQAGTTGSNVVQRKEDTKLITEHQELFAGAITALNDYRQYLAAAKYTEAAAFKAKVEAAVAKTTPGAIGADPRAAYSSDVMISIRQISNLLSSAEDAYTSALSDFQADNKTSGDTKLAAGQAKAQDAEASYNALVD